MDAKLEGRFAAAPASVRWPDQLAQVSRQWSKTWCSCGSVMRSSGGGWLTRGGPRRGGRADGDAPRGQVASAPQERGAGDVPAGGDGLPAEPVGFPEAMALPAGREGAGASALALVAVDLAAHGALLLDEPDVAFGVAVPLGQRPSAAQLGKQVDSLRAGPGELRNEARAGRRRPGPVGWRCRLNRSAGRQRAGSSPPASCGGAGGGRIRGNWARCWGSTDSWSLRAFSPRDSGRSFRSDLSSRPGAGCHSGW